jgi:hypothetical protein
VLQHCLGGSLKFAKLDAIDGRLLRQGCQSFRILLDELSIALSLLCNAFCTP